MFLTLQFLGNDGLARGFCKAIRLAPIEQLNVLHWHQGGLTANLPPYKVLDNCNYVGIVKSTRCCNFEGIVLGKQYIQYCFSFGSVLLPKSKKTAANTNTAIFSPVFEIRPSPKSHSMDFRKKCISLSKNELRKNCKGKSKLSAFPEELHFTKLLA